MVRRRLTKKQENQLSCHHYKKCDYLRNGTPRVETLTKLGKLEDLEEQLGCPLEVMFKALEEGLYVNFKVLDSEVSDTIERPSLYYSDDFKCYCFDLFSEYIVKLSDYQKTWWLKGEKSND